MIALGILIGIASVFLADWLGRAIARRRLRYWLRAEQELNRMANLTRDRVMQDEEGSK